MKENELDVHSERLNTIATAMVSASEVFALLTAHDLNETDFLLKTKETIRQTLVFFFGYSEDDTFSEMRSDLAERFKQMPVGSILPLLDGEANNSFMPMARTLLLGSEQELDALLLSWRRKPAAPIDPMTLPVTNAGLAALLEDIKGMFDIQKQINEIRQVINRK